MLKLIAIIVAIIAYGVFFSIGVVLLIPAMILLSIIEILQGICDKLGLYINPDPHNTKYKNLL